MVVDLPDYNEDVRQRDRQTIALFLHGLLKSGKRPAAVLLDLYFECTSADSTNPQKCLSNAVGVQAPKEILPGRPKKMARVSADGIGRSITRNSGVPSPDSRACESLQRLLRRYSRSRRSASRRRSRSSSRAFRRCS